MVKSQLTLPVNFPLDLAVIGRVPDFTEKPLNLHFSVRASFYA
jgi:hypothetical protein